MTLRTETEYRPAPSTDSGRYSHDFDHDVVAADDAAGHLMGRGALSIMAARAGSIRFVRDSPFLRTITTAYRQFFLWPVDLRVRVYRMVGLYLAEQRRYLESSFEAWAHSPVASARELGQQIADLCSQAPILSTSDIEMVLARSLISRDRARYSGFLNRSTAHHIVESFLGDPARGIERLDERTRYTLARLEDSRGAAARPLSDLNLLQVLSTQTALAGVGIDYQQEQARVRGTQSNSIIADDRQVLADVPTDDPTEVFLGDVVDELTTNALRDMETPAITAGTPLVVGADGYFRPAAAGETPSACALGPPEADGSIWASYDGQPGIVRQAPPPPPTPRAGRADMGNVPVRALRNALRTVVNRLLGESATRNDEYTRSVTAIYASLYAMSTVDGSITGADLRNGLDTTVFSTEGLPLFRLSISPIIAEAAPLPESRSIDL